MTSAGSWHVPADSAGHQQRDDARPTPSVSGRGGEPVPAARWYNVLWRGRVLETSSGDAEGALSAVVEAMRGSSGVYGTPGCRVLDAHTFAFEVWIGSTDQGSAAEATRRVLQAAFERAAVGDGRPGGPAYDVMLMLEEWPTVRRGAS